MVAPPSPGAEVTDAALAAPVFTEITASAGLGFVHEAGVTGAYRYAEIMGPGGALADLNGDGRLDIYLVDGGGERGRHDRLYLQASDGTFADATASSGLSPAGYGMGVTAGDYDNDGDLDLYLTCLGADELWRNDGDATFTAVTAAAGLGNDLWSVSATFLDYDRDGRLDLYVVNYLLEPDWAPCYDQAGRRDYCGPEKLPPAPDRLYHNEGGGRFRDVSAESGIGSLAGPGLGVIAADLDDDGWIDLYVANDMARNFLWINGGDGTFRERAVLAGCAYNRDGNAEAGMGIAPGDVDGDGNLDLLVTHLRGETNTLYRRADAVGFVDDTDAAGLGLSSTPYTGFGASLADLDLDGDLDLLVVNGAVKRRSWVPPATEGDAYWRDYAEPNLLYLNDGAARFTDVSAAVGPLCDRLEVSRGLVLGDVDGDGDLDVLVTQTAGPARLFRNDGRRLGRWLVVRAVDPGLRRDALGAVVTVVGEKRRWRGDVLAAHGYAGCGPAAVHFGLGEATRVEAVDVRWPDGVVERFAGVPLDAAVQLQRGAGAAAEAPR